jgi:hypothetical protein
VGLRLTLRPFFMTQNGVWVALDTRIARLAARRRARKVAMTSGSVGSVLLFTHYFLGQILLGKGNLPGPIRAGNDDNP